MYAIVARKLGIRRKDLLEYTITIELRILDVWFPALLHDSNSSMAEQFSTHVTVCYYKAFGDRDGAVVSRALGP